MKKSLFILFLLTCSLFAISFVNAQVNVNPENIEDPLGIGINPQELPQNPEDIQNASTTYLTQEWTKILEKYPLGQVLLAISDFLTKLNPLFNLILGVDYSLSWAFVFAVLIWLILFLFLFNPVGAILGNKVFGFIAAFIITCLIGVSGVIKQAVDLLSFMISNTWIAWTSLAIALLIGFLMLKLGKASKELIEKKKEEEAKEKTKQDREIISTVADAEKEGLTGEI
ncbi:MAG: hypothetical protein WC781_02860 [Candidatus Pacearchaeota archaeon]|jgi:hypothetical protein